MIDSRWKAFGGAAAVFALDRLTKWIIETRVSFLDTYHVIPGFFDIVHSQNSGVAFGMLSRSESPLRTALLVGVAMTASIIICAMLWRGRDLNKFTLWGLALILGGAAGNVFDRVMWGRVTDFLLFYVGEHQWPTFNIADSGIVIGSGLLLLDMFLPKRRAANVP